DAQWHEGRRTRLPLRGQRRLDRARRGRDAPASRLSCPSSERAGTQAPGSPQASRMPPTSASEAKKKPAQAPALLIVGRAGQATTSLIAFIAVARTDRLAGRASTFTISPVNGLRAMPALRAGFCTRRNLTPTSGTANSPEPFLARWRAAR